MSCIACDKYFENAYKNMCEIGNIIVPKIIIGVIMHSPKKNFGKCACIKDIIVYTCVVRHIYTCI